MQHDEVIWGVINPGHCSFKAKTVDNTFCRNKHNVTGLCNRTSCPLANSKYATLMHEEGTVLARPPLLPPPTARGLAAPLGCAAR